MTMLSQIAPRPENTASKWSDKNTVFAESRKYDTLKDFKKNSATAYRSALKKGSKPKLAASIVNNRLGSCVLLFCSLRHSAIFPCVRSLS